MLRSSPLLFALRAVSACPSERGARREPHVDPPSPAADRATLAVGDAHACFVASGGRLFCSGRNLDGQVGDGTTVSAPGVAAVRGLPPVDRVACGEAHTCAVAGGSLYCWGRNVDGQLGVGDTATRTTPTRVAGIEDVVDVALGSRSTCAVTRAGATFCFGSLGEGPGGVSSVDRADRPTRVSPLAPAVAVAMGDSHACALTRRREVFCWGDGRRGQIGGTAPRSSAAPIRVANLEDATAIAAGGATTCAITGTHVRCLGASDQGQLGDGSHGVDVGSLVPVEVVGLDRPTAVVVGAAHACARLADGRVKCWGEGRGGELGRGGFESFPRPVVVGGLDGAAAIAAGGHATCALRSGTRALACWGQNGDGAFGNGAYEPARTAVTTLADIDRVDARPPIVGAPRANSPGASPLVAMGDASACAIRADGAIDCDGYDRDGRLGGDGASEGASVRAIGDARDLGSYGAMTCAARASGAVACWGRGNRSVGAPTVRATSTPLTLPGASDAIGVDVGRDFVCFVRREGSVACSGENGLGQLGDSTWRSTDSVVEVVGIDDATAVAAGQSFACALRRSGSVACWGDGSRGQLGGGTTARSNLASPVTGLRDAIAIAANGADACAVRRSGGVVCWGELGRTPPPATDPTAPLHGVGAAFSTTPVAITALPPARAVAVAHGFVCALDEDGAARCWGPLPLASSSPRPPHTLDTNLVTLTEGPADPSVAIDASDDGACILRRSGALDCYHAARPLPPGATMFAGLDPWAPLRLRTGSR